MPETPEVPETPETPEVPEEPETPEVPETPETPEDAEEPEDVGEDEESDYGEAASVMDAGVNANSVKINATNFPDPVFRAWVTKNIGKGSSTLSESQINKVTSIDVSGKGIGSLEGIKLFKNLETLNCSSNKLDALDLSGLTALKTLVCSHDTRHQFRSLDVSGCTALETLDCSDNGGFNGLDVTGCIALKKLDCSSCRVGDLFLDTCTALEELDCSDGHTTRIVFFEDAEYEVGCTKLKKLDCNNCYLDNRSPAPLNLSGLTALEELDCSGNGLYTLDASGCTALKKLSCSDNALTALDLSACPALQELHCGDNALTALDLSRHTELGNLYCDGNRLTALDLDGCGTLKTLHCSQNALTALDLDGCGALSDLDCSQNALTALDLSGCGALQYLGCSGNGLTGLDVGDCTGLKCLDCSGNPITGTLDLSDCPALEMLNCADNRLTGLDLDGCTVLEKLDCSNNRLTALDLDGCIVLEKLDCSGNSLTKLDVSGCTALAACIESGSRARDVSVFGIPRVTLTSDESFLRVDESLAQKGLVPSPYAPTLKLQQNYLIFKKPVDANDSYYRRAIYLEELDLRWKDKVQWAISADGSVPEAFQGAEDDDFPIYIESFGHLYESEDKLYCTVVSKEVGTAYLVVYIRDDDGTVLASDTCRIDVSEHGGGDITGVRISQTKFTLELYKAEYPRFTVIPELPQNTVAAAGAEIIGPGYGMQQGSMAIMQAQFEGEAGSYFRILVVDDRTLEIRPWPGVILPENSGKLKSSYTHPIKLFFSSRNGQTSTITTKPVTLTIKKSLPKVKGKAVKLDSFLPGNTKTLSFGSAIVSAVPDSSKATPIPDWLSFDEASCSVSYTGAPGLKKSGKLYLMVQPKGWNVRFPVTVSVSAAKSSPKLTIKPASISLISSVDDWVTSTVSVSPAKYNDPEHLPVQVISVKEGKKTVEDVLSIDQDGKNLRIELGKLAPTDGKTHTYKVTLAIMSGGQPSSARKTLTVKVLPASTKLSLKAKASGKIDAAVPYSPAYVNVTVKGVNSPELFGSTITIMKKSKTGSEDVTDEFGIRRENDSGTRFSVHAKDASTLQSGCTYSAVIRYSNGLKTVSGSVKLPVKFSKPAKVKPSATLKVKGAIDVIRPDSAVTVTPTVKNYYTYDARWDEFGIYQPKAGDLHVWRAAGKTLTDVTEEFDVSLTTSGSAFYVKLKPGSTLNITAYKYKVSLSATVPTANGELSLTSAKTAMTVKMGKAKVNSSAKSVTLVKNDFPSTASLTLSPTDSYLAPIDWARTASKFVSPKGKDKQPVYKLIPLSDYSCAIGYAGDNFKSAKNGTVKIPVYFVGNNSSKPNVTISVKVSLMNSTPNYLFQ